MRGKLRQDTNAGSLLRAAFPGGSITGAPNQEGQIPLPNDLRQYAGIEDEAIVVGLCTHLEVWNPQRWQEVNDQTVKEGAAVAERLSHLEI